MELIGTIIVYIIMVCAIAGGLASAFRPDSELGKQFVAGIDSIGPIFLPVAGIMAAAPYLTAFVGNVFGSAFGALGADPAMAATTFIAVDMGGYQLADALAQTREGWIMAMMTGYMAGATIVFTIPVALKMLVKKDRKFLALGVMSGLLAIPVGVLVSSSIIAFSNPLIREGISTNADARYQLALGFGEIFLNLVPLLIVCVALALGLKFAPDVMIKGFIVFGKVLEAALKIVFVLVVVEYFTGVFSKIFGSFGFDPIIADDVDPFRALEVSGAIGMMLCGAFPMVYLMQKYLEKPLAGAGRVVGLSPEATTGLFAASANVLAALAMVEKLRARDKVIVLAFAVCAAFLFGDHLSFTANFQPTLIVPVMAGKLVGGVVAIIFAIMLAVTKAEQLEAMDMEKVEAEIEAAPAAS
ncbi:ethanolamine utilization protein EutH [Actinomyces minihominis]|uniref:ethanolamine utilization protein EutH n=1 Tax=Actinomyces minihominis TaxID=2002838 RepID=UPI000C07AE51|nr:ethanolamine utilization protein EutH [Actinomyces minihominis]